MPHEHLTHKNALLYAMKAYDNSECVSMDEFYEDYRRLKYIKRLCRRYINTTRLAERLLLNHLIALVNVFGPEATVRLLFLKCDDDRSYRVLKPFLLYLNILPEMIMGIEGYDIITADIPLDEEITQRLREL